MKTVISQHGKKRERKTGDVSLIELPLTVTEYTGLYILQLEPVPLYLFHLDSSVDVVSEVAAIIFHEDELKVDMAVLELWETLEGEFELATVVQFDVLLYF